jgi:hypothetical protein
MEKNICLLPNWYKDMSELQKNFAPFPTDAKETILNKFANIAVSEDKNTGNATAVIIIVSTRYKHSQIKQILNLKSA